MDPAQRWRIVDTGLRAPGCDPQMQCSVVRDVHVERVESRVLDFFATRIVQCEGCVPADFAAVVRRAVDQPLLAR